MVQHTIHGKQNGFTYIFFLCFIFAYGIILGAFIEVYSTQHKRLQDDEFFYVSSIYIDSLNNYYKDHHNFPNRIELLLCDGETYPCKRYIRKLYKDPISKANFTYLKNEQNLVVGIRSISNRRIINFEQSKKYSADLYSEIDFTVNPILRN